VSQAANVYDRNSESLLSAMWTQYTMHNACQ